MFGVGGVLAEAVADVVFRPAPLDVVTRRGDDRLAGARRRCSGEFRGEAAVSRSRARRTAGRAGPAGRRAPRRRQRRHQPVDRRRVGHADRSRRAGRARHRARRRLRAERPRPSDEAFRALFEPRGVVVTGASTHPGKFGFVSLHNLLASGYAGAVFATNLAGEEVLGIRDRRRRGRSARRRRRPGLRVHAGGGQPRHPPRRARRRASGPRSSPPPATAEAGRAGQAAQDELVALGDELGMLVAGPNGQGVVSTPARLCAQIVAPYPPAGRIGVASQSGNFVSSFMNLARVDRCRDQPRRVGRQRRRGERRRLPRLLRRRPGDGGRARVHRDRRATARR